MERVITEFEQRVATRYPRYYEFLMSLGSTDAQRAAALGVTRMTARAYRLGTALPKASLAQAPAAASVTHARVALLSKLGEDMTAALVAPAAPEPQAA